MWTAETIVLFGALMIWEFQLNDRFEALEESQQDTTIAVVDTVKLEKNDSVKAREKGREK